MKIIVGVTGASGIILAKRLLEALKEKEIETHLVISENAGAVIRQELPRADLKKLASATYGPGDFSAPIVSGSFKTDGMVVVPCTARTLSAIANGFSHNLICRAADVCLKEERKLILVPREMPLSLIHLRNMVKAREAGATIIPPVLTFYNEPKYIDDMVNCVVGRILDSLGINNKLYRRWGT